jgi:hypothetical protein
VRRLLFFLSCAALVWILRAARDAAPPAPRGGDDAADVEAMIHRNDVVSAELTAAYVRVRTRVGRANRVVNRAAHTLSKLAGE